MSYQRSNNVRKAIQYFHTEINYVKRCVTYGLEEIGCIFTLEIHNRCSIIQGSKNLHAQKMLRRQEGPKTKVYLRANICRLCVFAEALIIKVGPSKVRNQAKPAILKVEAVFLTNLEHMLQRTATDLSTKPTTQQRLSCALKMPGCCFLNDTGQFDPLLNQLAVSKSRFS